MYKISFSLIIISICLFSCSKEIKSTQPNFVSIDLVYSNGWNAAFSIHVDSAKNLLVQKSNIRYQPANYKGILPDSTMEQLTGFLDTINSKKLDSSYSEQCCDCDAYKITIRTKNKKQTVRSMGDAAPAQLNKLVYLLLDATHGKNNLQKTDTVFNFENYTSLLPPVLAEPVVFTPPVSHNKKHKKK